jgi:CrcB protein
VVNTAGSLALGLAAGAIWAGDGPDWATALVGTGLCGALTTFSAFGHESLRLIEDGRWRAAAAHVAGSVLLAVTACTAGWEVSVALTG